MSNLGTNPGALWRMNLDELTLGVQQLRAATDETAQLVTDMAATGTILSGVTLLTGKGVPIGVNTTLISTGLATMRVEVQALAVGVEKAVETYLEVESQISKSLTLAVGPTALIVTAVAIRRGETPPRAAVEAMTRFLFTLGAEGIELVATTLTAGVPGAKTVLGYSIAAVLGMEGNFWNADPQQITMEMVGVAANFLGVTRIAPYDVENTTVNPGEDGWGRAPELGEPVSTPSMELLREFAYEKDTITVVQTVQADGSEAFAVIYPGTSPMGEGQGWADYVLESPFGPTGVVESMTTDSEYVIAATLKALETAGVPPDATLVPMGYSQGGTHALNVALDDRINAQYNVEDVLTVAAPVAQIMADNPELNIVDVSHTDDWVPALTGHSNAGFRNRTVIELSGYPEGVEVDPGVFGKAHNYGVNNMQLAQALKDPEIAAATQDAWDSLDSKVTEVTGAQQFTLSRQEAMLPQHPTNPIGRGHINPLRKPIEMVLSPLTALEPHISGVPPMPDKGS